MPDPETNADGITGEVIYVDRFGNLVTNIAAETIGKGVAEPESALTEIGHWAIYGLSRTFHDPAGKNSAQPDGLPLVALVGSNGLLEVAVRDGNACLELGVGVGQAVRVSFNSSAA